jgi:hypothetical protein
MSLVAEQTDQLRKVEQKLEVYLSSVRAESQASPEKSPSRAAIPAPQPSTAFAELFSAVEKLRKLHQVKLSPAPTEEELHLEHILQGFRASLQTYLDSPTGEAWSEVKKDISSAYLEVSQHYEAKAADRAVPEPDSET